MIGRQGEKKREIWKNERVSPSRGPTLELMVPEKGCSRGPNGGLFCRVSHSDGKYILKIPICNPGMSEPAGTLQNRSREVSKQDPCWSVTNFSSVLSKTRKGCYNQGF